MNLPNELTGMRLTLVILVPDTKKGFSREHQLVAGRFLKSGCIFGSLSAGWFFDSAKLV